MENIARRHGVEPFQVNTTKQHSSPLLDENHRWMNSGVFFTGQTIESDPIDTQHTGENVQMIVHRLSNRLFI